VETASDVMIIESEIKIAICLENWIEFEINTLAGIYNRFWLTAILAKTTHCSEFKEWQSEPRCVEYANLITQIACRGGRHLPLQ